MYRAPFLLACVLEPLGYHRTHVAAAISGATAACVVLVLGVSSLRRRLPPWSRVMHGWNLPICQVWSSPDARCRRCYSFDQLGPTAEHRPPVPAGLHSCLENSASNMSTS